jgi:hypothetical protein
MKKSHIPGNLIIGIIFLMLGSNLASCKKGTMGNSAKPDSSTLKIDTLVNTLGQDTAFERGGSNYGFWFIGSYLNTPTLDNWNKYVKPVIGTYHLAPDTVRNQLAVMYASGQRRLALDFWFTYTMPIEGYQDSGVCTHVVNSSRGEMFPQQQANLKALLHDIDQQGFETIVFRFEQQGDSDPLGWTSWDEFTYSSNWSFISHTINLIQNEIAGLHVKVIYDLGGELGGADFGMGLAYGKRLWSDYVKTYGPHNSMGYSYAVSPGRFTQSIAIYDEVGVRPDVYGFDVYGDEFNTYSYLLAEMEAAGETSKPVIANEVYYNDPVTYNQILQVRAQLHMNIKFLLQWPLSRDKPGYMCAVYPADFSAYDY